MHFPPQDVIQINGKDLLWDIIQDRYGSIKS